VYDGDHDTQTILESYVTGTDYRMIRVSGIWKLQKSTDNWATATDLFTYTYTSSVDLIPIADIRTRSDGEGYLVNPRQSGLVAI
jgi:hypothetical protein